jgi:hypothetical protein
MKKLPLTFMMSALATLFAASAARASFMEYSFSYTQVGETNVYGNATPPSTTDATGDIIVNTSTDLATAGLIDVTSGPQTGIYSLVLGASGGDQYGFQWDSVVTPGGSYFVDDIGIVFRNGVNEVNLWSNPSAQYGQPEGSYSLWGSYPEYNPESWGTLSFAPVRLTSATALPDGGMTVSMLGVAVLGLAFFRRKLA